MPVISVKSATRILAETDGTITAFPTTAHLAATSGLAPITRRSGSSIRAQHVHRGGNKHLKNALFTGAFTSLRAEPTSRAHYDRKRAQGKRHNAALICLARRTTDGLFSMLRDHPPYTSSIPIAARPLTKGQPRMGKARASK